MFRNAHLLIVAESLKGGLASAALADARCGVEAGFQVVLAGTLGHGQKAPELPAGAEFVDIPFPKKITDFKTLARSRRALRYLVRSRPRERTWIHVHGLKPLLAIPGGYPTCVTYHGARGLPGTSRLVEILRSKALQLTPRFVRHAFTVCPLEIPGWHDIWIDSPRKLLEAPSRTYGRGLRLLWLSRINRQKNFGLFLDLVRNLQELPCFEGAWVVGEIDNSLLQLVRIASANLPITFFGHQTDTEKYLSQDVVFCLFSHFEGRPFALEEAVSAGLPVVATDLPGNRLLVDQRYLVTDLVSAERVVRNLADSNSRMHAGAKIRASYVERMGNRQALQRVVAGVYAEAFAAFVK